MRASSLETALTVELPGSDMPSASATMHMEFAVVMEVHPPHVPQECSMRPLYSSGSIFPAFIVPTLSCAWICSTSRPRNVPSGM